MLLGVNGRDWERVDRMGKARYKNSMINFYLNTIGSYFLLLLIILAIPNLIGFIKKFKYPERSVLPKAPLTNKTARDIFTRWLE